MASALIFIPSAPIQDNQIPMNVMLIAHHQASGDLGPGGMQHGRNSAGFTQNFRDAVVDVS
jgi:hypothetical protein